MVVNQVVVFPTTETLEHLKLIFKNCPIQDINNSLDSMFVVLNEQSSPATLNPSKVYTAKAGTLGYWYDDNLGASSLILPLESDDLVKKMASLRVSYGTVFHPDPLPFTRLVANMPPLHRDIRYFIASVSDTLLTINEPLLFTGETQRPVEYDLPPDALYYEDHGLV